MMSISSFPQELATLADQLRLSNVQVLGNRFGAGSGVIWKSDGVIVTNAHVVPSNHAKVQLADGRVFDAVRTAYDPRLDLATLKISATDLCAATVGDSDALRVGEIVMAIGNPLGLVDALTTGIIYAVTPKQPSSNQKWVIADVRLAPGNSGGMLADARGRVIGINTMIVNGLGVAVPSNTVERFLRGAIGKPYLGVSMQPVLVPLGRRRRVYGLLLLEIASDSLAQKAGLLQGDVLIAVNGEYFSTPDHLVSVLQYAEPGESLSLEFVRSGKQMSCTVVVPGTTLNEVKAA